MKNTKYPLKKEVKKDELSPFAKFHFDSLGLDFITKKGSHVFKWQVFASGYNNLKNIIQGKTPFIAVDRP